MQIQLSHDIKFTVLVTLFLSFSFFQLYQSPPSIALSVGIVAFAYFYTDIISGILHLILDDEQSLNIPLIRSLAVGFQRHHEAPNSIYEMSLYKHLYVMHLPLAIVYPLVLIFNDTAQHTLYVAIALMLHLMQMSHRWAHQPRTVVSAPLRFLQSAHVFLGSPEHGTHHKSPFDTNFCIMNGWFNPCLNQIYSRLDISLNTWIYIFLAICLLPLFIVSLAGVYL